MSDATPQRGTFLMHAPYAVAAFGRNLLYFAIPAEHREVVNGCMVRYAPVRWVEFCIHPSAFRISLWVSPDTVEPRHINAVADHTLP